MGLLVNLVLPDLFLAQSHSLVFLGMLWVSRDTCSLVDQALGECGRIGGGVSEILTLSKLVFPSLVRWLLTVRDSVLYSAKSR